MIKGKIKMRKIYTNEDIQRIIKHIKEEREKGKGYCEIRDSLGLSNSFFTKLKNQIVEYKQCEICGNKFRVEWGNEKCCSEECKLEYKRRKNLEYVKKSQKNQYVRNRSMAEKIHDREFTKISDEIICINDFEGYDVSFTAETMRRTKQAVHERLEQLKNSGKYDKIIKTWALQAPLLYKRALRRRTNDSIADSRIKYKQVRVVG
jgi:predicted nucleic acid-binding Zn ribbon protein